VRTCTSLSLFAAARASPNTASYWFYVCLTFVLSLISKMENFFIIDLQVGEKKTSSLTSKIGMFSSARLMIWKQIHTAWLPALLTSSNVFLALCSRFSLDVAEIRCRRCISYRCRHHTSSTNMHKSKALLRLNMHKSWLRLVHKSVREAHAKFYESPFITLRVINKNRRKKNR
jgi:hypothetical protein